MGQTRRACTREFKQEAVKLVTAGGHPTAQTARDLGITPNLLRRWTPEVAGDPVAPTKRSAPGSRGRGTKPFVRMLAVCRCG